jgi:hypothetical protein
MPLLHIVGVNSSNRNFSIAFCFIPSEKKEEYTWALEQLHASIDKGNPSVFLTNNEQALINAINLVFPNYSHHLCSWHIKKNIESNCSKHFKSEAEWTNFQSQWNKLINSDTVTEYHKNFTQLTMAWNPPTSDYILKNILPLKEKIISCFINEHHHFGNTVTS